MMLLHRGQSHCPGSKGEGADPRGESRTEGLDWELDLDLSKDL